MKVLVCGGRTFRDKRLLDKVMDDVLKFRGQIDCVIEGGARGADLMAKAWAKYNGIPVIEIEAQWDHYGQSAGPIRNAWMLLYGQPDLVVAFPGGTGTENMVKKAEDAGIEVWQALDYIVCPRCGMKSFNPGDIVARYCGACHEYHADL